MNYIRILVAAVAATVVDAVYGFVVYGNMLTPQFAAYPGVYRPRERAGRVHADPLRRHFHRDARRVIYLRKGYEGGPGAAEGLRFGIVVGLLAPGIRLS